jgi:hypothetical protein
LQEKPRWISVRRLFAKFLLKRCLVQVNVQLTGLKRCREMSLHALSTMLQSADIAAKSLSGNKLTSRKAHLVGAAGHQ